MLFVMILILSLFFCLARRSVVPKEHADATETFIVDDISVFSCNPCWVPGQPSVSQVVFCWTCGGSDVNRGRCRSAIRARRWWLVDVCCWLLQVRGHAPGSQRVLCQPFRSEQHALLWDCLKPYLAPRCSTGRGSRSDGLQQCSNSRVENSSRGFWLATRFTYLPRSELWSVLQNKFCFWELYKVSMSADLQVVFSTCHCLNSERGASSPLWFPARRRAKKSHPHQCLARFWTLHWQHQQRWCLFKW